MLVRIITSKDTSTYCVLTGRSKLSELEDSDTISVVLGEMLPPRSRIFPSSPGRLQQRWPSLSTMSEREGRGKTSVPVTFSQDLSIDEFKPLPQMRLPQLEW